MVCRYTYQGKTYSASEFDDILRAMPPAEAAKFMPNVESVPSAPFVGRTDAWVSLALKRMIRYAAEHGFDAIAWTTGEQQAERYSLSHAVDSIEWIARPTGARFVTVALRAGGPATMVVDAKGGITAVRGNLTNLEGKNLDEAVGKDVAKRIMETDGGSLEGEGLNIGGEGMKSFYDRIVPAVAKDVLKKLGGGQLGAYEIDIQGRFTPNEGLRVQYEYRGPDVSADDVLRAAETSDPVTIQRQLRDVYGAMGRGATLATAMREHGSIAAANAVGGDMVPMERVASQQPGFAITPELRAKSMQGMPLFSRAVQPQGGGPVAPFGVPVRQRPREGVLNRVVRGAFQTTRADRLSRGAMDLALRIGEVSGEKLTPAVSFGQMSWEDVKAGMVDKYGLDEVTIDRRAQMYGHQAVQLRGVKNLLDQMATLTRAEAAVLYRAATTADPTEVEEMIAGLDENSQSALRTIKQVVRDLGAEAVRLGQMTDETFQRNEWAYLHRSYLKHELDDTEAGKASRARRIQILGDHYKRRGLVDWADPKKIANVAPEFWGRKAVPGRPDYGLKGQKFVRLERRKNRGEGVAVLDGMEETGQRGRLLEVLYWPAGEAIPARYGSWDNVGTWEARFFGERGRGGAIGMWRDFTADERQKMGEIDDIRYAFAKTMHTAIHNVEVGKYLLWLADTHAVPDEGRVPEGATLVERDESSLTGLRRVFRPNEWVRVPDTRTHKGGPYKYGALAGKIVPGPIWNDVRQVVNNRWGPEWWNTLLRTWKISKALALDTPIPTPSGWTTMGALKPGDQVFDERGEPCEVLQATEVQHDHECYEVEFSDGTKIVADAGHLWYTEFHGRPGVRETRDILATLKERTRGDNNHRIPVAAPLQLPDVELPIAPYALGVWLGDGDSNSARVTAGKQDLDAIICHLKMDGVRCGEPSKDRRGDVYSFSIRRDGEGCLRGHDLAFMTRKGCRKCDNERRRAAPAAAPTNIPLKAKMRAMGLLGHKHVPDAYLRASVAQRMALLQGLMDTDGNVTEQGLCTFATSMPVLRDGFVELARSLGFKPSVTSFVPNCNGKVGKLAWRIHFKAYSDRPVFRLARKIERLCAPPTTRQRSQTRQIVAVTSVPSVPVRCILVSSPSHLFLAGEGMVPTHNTALSPAVHMNNIMANVVMADWHDVSPAHVLRSLEVLARQKRPENKRLIEMFEDSGGTQGMYVLSEIQREQLDPVLEQLRRDLAGSQMGAAVGMGAAVQALMAREYRKAFAALRESKAGSVVKVPVQKLIDLYQGEDTVFRLAAFIKVLEEGGTPAQAGKFARRSFLDYDINAPWVQAMRNSVFPFISFTYRAVPMLIEVARERPWKLAKLAMILGAINAAGYLFSGGDEDEERKLLPEEKAGNVLGLLGPKLLRMPWNDENGSPVFLDIRRWMPLGDFFDVGQTHAAIPILPAAVPGGPLAVLAEVVMNKSQFTGKPITKETDTGVEMAAKVSDHLFKAFAPNLPILPGTYSWTSIANAGGGKTDAFGREQSLGQAALSSVGVKVGSYPEDVLRRNLAAQHAGKVREIGEEISKIRRQYERKGITREQFEKRLADQVAKRVALERELAEKVGR